jgi:hypothetical protein
MFKNEILLHLFITGDCVDRFRARKATLAKLIGDEEDDLNADGSENNSLSKNKDEVI